MQREVIEVELSLEERALILRYGYPFDRIKQALAEGVRRAAQSKLFPLDKFELERLIGDLSKSVTTWPWFRAKRLVRPL